MTASQKHHRPKVQPIRNPTLFEMEKLELAANLTTGLKIDRPYALLWNWNSFGNFCVHRGWMGRQLLSFRDEAA